MSGQELQRVVGLPGAILLGLGSILGTGVFVSLGLAAGIVGPGVVLAVALAAVVATANGLSSAQLAAAHPVSGGTYEYGYQFLNPYLGFTAGTMYMVAKSASAATAALGCAGYIWHMTGMDAGDYGVRGLAVGITLTITALVASGMRRSNVANTAVVSLTILSLVAFVVFGWVGLDSAVASANLALDGVFDGPVNLLHATALMFVAYTGYGRIATLGEEVKDPAKTIPKAVIATLFVSMVLYVSVSATAVATVGVDTFVEATKTAVAPLEVVAQSFSVPAVAYVVAIGAITAMAGVLLNLVLGLSRVMLAMGRRKDVSERYAEVDAKQSSPTRAVWHTGLFIAALSLWGDVSGTWSFSAVTVLVYYGITNLAALNLPVEARRFPRVISWFGLLSCLSLAFFVEWPFIAAGAGTVALALVFKRISNP